MRPPAAKTKFGKTKKSLLEKASMYERFVRASIRSDARRLSKPVDNPSEDSLKKYADYLSEARCYLAISKKLRTYLRSLKVEDIFPTQ